MRDDHAKTGHKFYGAKNSLVFYQFVTINIFIYANCYIVVNVF